MKKLVSLITIVVLALSLSTTYAKQNGSNIGFACKGSNHMCAMTINGVTIYGRGTLVATIIE